MALIRNMVSRWMKLAARGLVPTFRDGNQGTTLMSFLDKLVPNFAGTSLTNSYGSIENRVAHPKNLKSSSS